MAKHRKENLTHGPGLGLIPIGRVYLSDYNRQWWRYGVIKDSHGRLHDELIAEDGG